MPQSLARVLVHLVFSTKNREPIIGRKTRPQLHEQEELRHLLKRYQVAYDERYVWD